MERYAPYGMSPTLTSSPARRLLIGSRRPRTPAGVTGVEPLLGDAEGRVHAGPHVLHADLVRQLDHAVVAESAFQVGDLFVGDGVRVGGHRVGVGDRGSFVVGVGG